MFAVRDGINKKLLQTSPLGEYSAHLTALHRLTSIKPVSRALTHSKQWLGSQHSSPQLADSGRQVLSGTLLGPAFALTVVPDPLWNNANRPQPSVGEQCFSDYQNWRPGDVMASMQSLRMTMSSVVDSLHNICMNFLRNQVRDLSC